MVVAALNMAVQQPFWKVKGKDIHLIIDTSRKLPVDLFETLKGVQMVVKVCPNEMRDNNVQFSDVSHHRLTGFT